MRGGKYKQGKGWTVKFPVGHGKPIRKWFGTQDKADRFLTGLRFKWDEKTFDVRDYQSDNPLGFSNLVDRFLESKRLLKGVGKYEERLSFAIQEFGNNNVKNICFREIDTLLIALRERGYSSTYVKHIRDTTKTFYRWLQQTGEINELPQFPVVKASSPYRKIIDKATQQAILSEIHRLTWDINPRIYIGVLFLATYINLRPAELIQVKEKDIDLDSGRILIRETKTGDQKYVFLLEPDCKIIRDAQRTNPAFPELFFFRHLCARGGQTPNTRFGKSYLYRWWKEACRNLRIDGVDLYGGTRHSSAIGLREFQTPEEIRRATGHRTSAAFNRYLEIQGDELRQIYAKTRGSVVELKINQQADKK